MLNRLKPVVADGTVDLTADAGPYVGLVDKLPERAGHRIRMVDLATHSSGFGRELRPVAGATKYIDASFAGNLAGDPLLFAPGTGILYSNIGFDVLAMALSGVAKKPYRELLQETVLDPLGLKSTGYARPTGDNVMTGYDWNGEAMDPGEPIANRRGNVEAHEAWWIAQDPGGPILPGRGAELWTSHYDRQPAATIEFSNYAAIYYVTITNYHSRDEVNRRAPYSRLELSIPKPGGQESLDL